MRRLVVNNSVTLDGVMQAPGHPDEDRRDGFAHGGWAGPYFDEVMAQHAGEGMTRTGGFVFGRRTYENFASVWPQQGDANPFAAVLNRLPKHVASRTLRQPLSWANSALLDGDAADALGRLKSEPGGDLVILGSGDLIRSLVPHGLIDELTLLVHPLVLGAGRRLFGDGARFAFRLVDARPTTTGVIIATYQPG
ncbi:MAG: dihydrofolate reductase family protein [Chloroflexota bacterium]|nr:dihydrofolate reductase family protein [Chloroflexota bacterium]